MKLKHIACLQTKAITKQAELIEMILVYNKSQDFSLLLILITVHKKQILIMIFCGQQIR